MKLHYKRPKAQKKAIVNLVGKCNLTLQTTLEIIIRPKFTDEA